MQYKLTIVAGLLSTLVACSEAPLPVERPESKSVALSADPVFPLKLSSNTRYLVDQNNTPFLINQASSWGLIQCLSTADATEYLDDLKQRGFNAVMVSVISYDTRMAGNPPNWQGVSPFNVPWDYSTYNEAYFAHADAIINLAKDRGMLVTLVPSYLGYPGEPTQGWWDEMLSANNSTAKSQAYGTFLGQRYKNFSNIIWIAGGDYTPGPGSTLENRLKAIIDAIRVNDPGHLWTGHWDSVGHGNGVFATENPTFAPIMNINGYYAYDYDFTFQRDLEAYNKTPPMMLYNLDQSYETEPGGTPGNIRRKAYQAMLMGSAGSSFAAGPTWVTFTNWRSTMDSPAGLQNQIWLHAFQSRPWYDLIPDQNHVAVTSGLGNWNSVDYLTAARTSSGSTLMAYVPSSRPVTVDMSKISGSQANVWWYNPLNGQATLSGTFPTSGSRDVTPPTNNDWLLVIDDASLNLAAPGSQIAPTSSPPSVASAASANTNPTAGTTTTLSVLGADDGGEAALRYEWAVTSAPSGGSATFSRSGSNGAKSSVATFTQAGAYTLQARIVDGEGQAVTSSVLATVQKTQTGVTVSPTLVTVPPSAQQQFNAIAIDQFGAPMTVQPTIVWSVNGGGTLSQGGLFTASSVPAGPFTVTANAGGQIGTASFTVATAPAVTYRINSGGSAVGAFTVDQFSSGGGPFSTANPVVTAGVANAAPGSTYQTERFGNFSYTLPGLVAFAPYVVRLHFAEIFFTTSNSRLFNVAINGAQVLASFDVFAAAGGALKAVVRDFSVTANASGQIVIAFTGVRDQAKVSAIELLGGSGSVNQAPTVATPASANATPITDTTAGLSVLGADDGGEAALTYTWATVGTPPAAVTFNGNGTNAAKNAVATFSKAGSYDLRATVTDAGNLTATSNVSVVVNQTPSSIALSPLGATVAPLAAQQFSATARDQFGAALGSQPSFTWNTTGGGNISTSGLFTAGSTTGGPFTVSATGASLSGSANVTVSATQAALFRLDAGGGAVGGFAADQFFSGGTTFSNAAVVTTAGVANAGPAALYQSERFGNASYTLGGVTPNSPYVVRLHFAEIYWSSTNSRLFNVAINGAQVLSSFDIFAAAGAVNKAVVRDFAVTSNASGQVVIAFTTVKDNAKVSGIELLK